MSSLSSAFDAVLNCKLNELKNIIKNIDNINEFFGDNNETLLHTACKLNNFSIIQFLLNNNADIQCFDCNENTPLHIAVSSNSNDEIIKLLLNSNANCLCPNINNNLPIHIACKNNQLSIVKLLLEKDLHQLSQINNNDLYPIHIASLYGSLSILSYFIKIYDCFNDDYKNYIHINIPSPNYYWTCLHCAASSGNKHTIQYLLEHNADIHLQTNLSLTPLLIAKDNNHKDCFSLLKKAEIVESYSDISKNTIGISLYPFNKEIIGDLFNDKTDLSFKENTIICNIEYIDDNWCSGFIDNNFGIFPSSFITIKVLLISKVSHYYNAQRDDELSLQKNDTVKIYYDNGKGWFRVISENTNQCGYFPATHIIVPKSIFIKIHPKKKLQTSQSVVITRKKQNTKLKRIASTSATRKSAKTIKQYSEQHPGDLSINIDDIILLTKTRGAWWEGILNGKKGIFPAKCVKIIE